MTLAPVFRSPEAVRALQERGYWTQLEPSCAALREATGILHVLLQDVIDREYLNPSPQSQDDLLFIQENFFLILFHSVFKSVGCEEEHLHLYTLLNSCIRGLVLSGDNLFDDEDKKVLPLRLGCGKRFMSIVQMMCYQNLIRQVLRRHGDWLDDGEKDRFLCELLSTLTAIGTLEGSEETGVADTPHMEAMIEKVHRVRGGSLFSLAFIAPRIGERGKNRKTWEAAEQGIRSLGTAFQIVDDITDLEFDLGRGSHNLLVSQIVHEGTTEERDILDELRASPDLRATGGWVEKGLFHSAGRVLARAKEEAEAGFQSLKMIDFWFPPEDALLFVRAIAGDGGFERVQGLNNNKR